MLEFGELFLWIFPRISNGFEKLYQTFFFMFDIYITWKSFLWYLFNAELLQAWLAYGLWVTIIIVNGHDVEGFECDIHWHLPTSMCTHVGRVGMFVNKILWTVINKCVVYYLPHFYQNSLTLTFFGWFKSNYNNIKVNLNNKRVDFTAGLYISFYSLNLIFYVLIKKIIILNKKCGILNERKLMISKLKTLVWNLP